MHTIGKLFSAALIAGLLPGAAWAQGPVVVATTAKAGAVVGTKDNSDAFIWKLFMRIAAPAQPSAPSPVAFETWASDSDTFNLKPHWPTPGEPLKFHASALATLKAGAPSAGLLSAAIDVKCLAPQGAAVAGFPSTGTPAPCIAEQVQRNRPLFDYIVGHKLNTKAGLAAAYASPEVLDMPPAAIAVKGDWTPVPVLMAWIPSLKTPQDVERRYFTTTVGGVEYALLSMHVSSRQNPNWVWGTFENELTPGRCDYIGCFDSFGTTAPAMRPNRKTANSQYGPCPKTPVLNALMKANHLSEVWRHYCLKSTEVDYVAADGTPYVLGNSVIEGIVGNGTVAASSCISCHAYAAFGADGTAPAKITAILPFNPTGKPLAPVLQGVKQFSFNWGFLFAP